MATQVLIHLHPEGHYQVQNHWRSQRQERSINKIETDAASRDIHLLAQSGADAEGLFFNEVSNLIHVFQFAKRNYIR